MRLFVLASLLGLAAATTPLYPQPGPTPSAPPPMAAPFPMPAPAGVPVAQTPASLEKEDRSGCIWFNSTMSICNVTCGEGFQTSHKVFLGIGDDVKGDTSLRCTLSDGSRPLASELPIGFVDIGRRECKIKDCSPACAKCNTTGTAPGDEGCTLENGVGDCICKSGYGGPTCSISSNLCNSSPCLNGGTCQVLNDAVVCRCANGFDGPRCANDYCKPNCQAGNYLGCYKDSAGAVFCQCNDKSAGQKCDLPLTDKTCPSACSGRGACVNTYGSPVCECNLGSYGKICQFQDGGDKLQTTCGADQSSKLLECAIATTGNTKCDLYKGYLQCATSLRCNDVGAFWTQFPPVMVDDTCKGQVTPVQPSATCDMGVYQKCLVLARKILHGAGESAVFCVSSFLLSKCAAQAGCNDLLAMYCTLDDCPAAKAMNLRRPGDCNALG